jgi:hypothetical protein
MRLYYLDYHRKQVARLRARLEDTTNPPDKIIKPVGMRTKVFENRIQRLKKHEKMTVEILAEGLKKWQNRVY